MIININSSMQAAIQSRKHVRSPSLRREDPHGELAVTTRFSKGSGYVAFRNTLSRLTTSPSFPSRTPPSFLSPHPKTPWCPPTHTYTPPSPFFCCPLPVLSHPDASLQRPISNVFSPCALNSRFSSPQAKK